MMVFASVGGIPNLNPEFLKVVGTKPAKNACLAGKGLGYGPVFVFSGQTSSAPPVNVSLYGCGGSHEPHCDVQLSKS